NVSVRITDEFMEAEERGEKYTVKWPVDSEEPEVEEQIDAREVWEMIAKAATDMAEPGVMFWDTIERNLPANEYEGYRCSSSNPCQPAWATVLTPEGVRTMGEIQIGDTIWSGKQWTKVTNKVMTGVKPVFRYHTKAGIFYGTKEHKVIQSGKRVKVKDAENIDISVGPVDNFDTELDPQAVM